MSFRALSLRPPIQQSIRPSAHPSLHFPPDRMSMATTGEHPRERRERLMASYPYAQTAVRVVETPELKGREISSQCPTCGREWRVIMGCMYGNPSRWCRDDCFSIYNFPHDNSCYGILPNGRSLTEFPPEFIARLKQGKDTE